MCPWLYAAPQQIIAGKRFKHCFGSAPALGGGLVCFLCSVLFYSLLMYFIDVCSLLVYVCLRVAAHGGRLFRVIRVSLFVGNLLPATTKETAIDNMTLRGPVTTKSKLHG